MFTLELENERLQRQLLLLQEQNLQARHRRKDDREGRHRARAGRRAATSIRPVPALDTRYLSQHRPRQTGNLIILKEKPVTLVNSLKERIDSDVQNKFGYDLGTSRFVAEVPDREPQSVERERANVGMKTLLPDGTMDNVPPRPEELVQPLKNSDSQHLPYYRNHLASRKLNQVEQGLRDSYSRTSQPNVSGEGVDLPTARSELEEGVSYTQRARPTPLPRPQLLINDVPVK